MKSITPNLKNIGKKFMEEEATEPSHKKSKKFKKPLLKFKGMMEE
jgi:hypothetical protein